MNGKIGRSFGRTGDQMNEIGDDKMYTSAKCGKMKKTTLLALKTVLFLGV